MPPRPEPPDSRARLLAAAGVEFADHGFAGASVDRIARRAAVNKAMIYYHFGSKAGLYQDIVRDMYRVVGRDVEAIADSDQPPDRKIAAFVETVIRQAARRAHFPRLMMREVADRGRRLQPETLRLFVVVPAALARILEEGVQAGRFRPIHPLLAFMTILGPVVVFFASAPLRARAFALLPTPVPEPSVEALVAHVQQVALAMLGAQPEVLSVT